MLRLDPRRADRVEQAPGEGNVTHHREMFVYIDDAASGIEATSFGIMPSWLADSLAALLPSVPAIPPERRAETLCAVASLLVRAGTGRELPRELLP